MRPWGKLCAAYPRFELSKATVVVYHERLCSFSVDELMAAAEIAIDQYDFFPSAAQLRRIGENLPQPKRALLDEPRPSPEEAAKVQTLLQGLADKFDATKEEPKA